MKIFDFLVGKNIAYAAKKGGGTIADANEMDLLDVGALALFTEDNRLINLAALPAAVAAVLVGVHQVFWAVGRTTDVYISQKIDRDPFHRVKCAYLAPTLQVTTITTFGFPVTITAGQELELAVSVPQEGIEPAVEIQRYSLSTTAVDTPTTILNKLVAKINATPANKLYVTAAVTVPGTTITLTAIKKNMTFDVSLNGLIENAVATVSTPAVFSQGDGDDLMPLEEEFRTMRGHTSRVKWADKLFTQPTELVAAATYVQYIWQWEQEARSSLNSQNAVIKGVQLVIPSGAAVIGQLDALYATIFGTLPNTGSGNGVYTAL